MPLPRVLICHVDSVPRSRRPVIITELGGYKVGRGHEEACLFLDSDAILMVQSGGDACRADEPKKKSRKEKNKGKNNLQLAF